MSEVTLKVFEALKNDVGRGIVRLDTKTRDTLGVSAGDIIEITGKRATGAIIWRTYPEDEGLDIIRMDGFLRQNADVLIGDKVTVEKVKVKDAQNVTFAPTQRIKYTVGFGDFVKRRVMGRPVTAGDQIVIGVLGTTLQFTVFETLPKKIVRIADFTKVNVLDKPFDIAVSMKSTESLIADVIKYGADASNVEKLLQKARNTSTASSAMEHLDEAMDAAKRIKGESKPNLSLKIIDDDFQVDRWNKLDIEFTNSGNANAKNVKIELIAPDANIKGAKKISVLKSKERGNLEIGIRPFDSGNLPLEANVTYLDFDGTKYELEDAFWIKVSDPKVKKKIEEGTYCITGGICNQEIKSNEKQYFVGHSFTQQHKEDLRKAIENGIEKFNMQPYYADREVRRGTILCKICKKIRSTRLGIYEISDKNPNVMIELGVALGFGKPVLLISREGSDIPSDINNLDRIVYGSFNGLTKELEVKIKKFIT